MSFGRVSVRLGGVFMRLHSMLMGGFMIALWMVLSCRIVSLLLHARDVLLPSYGRRVP
jgi:hypothetical protein